MDASSFGNKSDRQGQINVDGSYYDPYYILQVTKDDSDEHIAKAYRKKAKRYHPDKALVETTADYTLKFKIVTEAYNYIRNKRMNVQKPNQDILSDFDVDKFNKNYDNQKDPSKYGYGEHNRIQKIEEYDDFTVDVVNQFAEKTFNQTDFNKLFEYNISCKEKSVEDVKTIVHKTTDGFHGYNTADVGSCAMVHSYNGLMVTGDDFGESGVGYWGEGYSDYKKTFTGIENPEQVVQVPSDYKKPLLNEGERTFEEYKSAYDLGPDRQRPRGSRFRNEQEAMCKTMMETLVDGEKDDEVFVLKYANQYKPELVRAAMNGELPRSVTLLDNLQEHYNVKKIGD